MVKRKKSNTIYIIITILIIISIISLYLLTKIQEKNYYVHSGSREERIERLDKYVEKHPGNTEAMIDLAKEYLDIREYQKAEDLLTQIIQIEPSHKMALYTYGRLLVEQFRFSEAIEQFEKRVAVNHDSIGSLRYLTDIYLIYDGKKSLEYAKKATDLLRQRYNQGEEDVNITFSDERENMVAKFNSEFEEDPAAATLIILKHYIIKCNR